MALRARALSNASALRAHLFVSLLSSRWHQQISEAEACRQDHYDT